MSTCFYAYVSTLSLTILQEGSSFNSSSTITDESFSSPPAEFTRSVGIVHDKIKCIW